MRQPLDFDRMISEGADLWRDDTKCLDAAEEFVVAAATDAQLQALALRARAQVRAERASLRGCLRQRFGVEVVGLPLGLEARVIDKELARPKSFADVAELDDTFVSFVTCDTACWAMAFSYKQAWARYAVKATAALWWAEKYRAVVPTLPFSSLFKAELLAYFYVRRNAPIAYSAAARLGKGPPAAKRLQEAALGALAAWVRARIRMYPSLKAAIGKGGDPQEALLRELPGAVLTELADLDAAWADPGKRAEVLHKMGGRGIHKYLTNRVSARMRAYGKEANDSSRHDVELAAWADREKLLRRGREAGLTPREYELFELFIRDPERYMRNGKLKHAEAAKKLGVATGTVKALWSRVRKTLAA